MKKRTGVWITTAAFVLIVMMGCNKHKTEVKALITGSPARFHIGIVTGTAAQSQDDLRGAERLIELYGSTENGGMIYHTTYPDDFMVHQDAVITQIAALADDPLMKAVVVNQAIPGTAEAFKRIRAARSDIILLAGEPHEAPAVIQAVADMAVSNDFISRGYTIIWAAKQLGAKTFVHISLPRHMSYKTLGIRRQIMEDVCRDLGIHFVFETAPDPAGSVGIAEAQQFIIEQVPRWIEKYGKKTVFFCTNDAHTELLLKQVLEIGGMFVEADLPSPLMGYPGALGINIPAGPINVDSVFDKVEQAVIDRGGAGRFGTWAFSYGFTVTAALGEYARRIIDGQAQKGSASDLSKAFAVFTPGARWRIRYYLDRVTGMRAKNQVLVFMDTYVFGKGFLPTTDQEIKQAYLNIAASTQ